MPQTVMFARDASKKMKNIVIPAVFLLALSFLLTEAKAEEILAWKDCINEAKNNHIDLRSPDTQAKLRTAFVNLLTAQELLNITENIAERCERNTKLVKLQYEAGREHKGSLLTMQANLGLAEFEAARAKRKIALAQKKLNSALGRVRPVPIRAGGKFEAKHYAGERPDFGAIAKKNPSMRSKEKSGRHGSVLLLEETWMDMQDAVERVEAQNRLLKASEERARIAGTQYSTGLISFDNWIIIENSLGTERKSFLEAQKNVLIAEAEWIQTNGGMLDDQ